MTDDSNHPPGFDPRTLPWRKSSFSGSAECVTLAPVPGDRVAIRDSKDPDGGMLLLSRVELATWLAAIKSGQLDRLVQ
jgi:hypothetical protein